MRWDTPTVTDNGLYLVRAKGILDSKQLTLPINNLITHSERSWLLENDIMSCYSGSYIPVQKIEISTYEASWVCYILLPKKLAVEFVLRFG